MTTSEEIAGQLYKKTTHGIKLGLDRVRRAAELVGNPHSAFASIHVAGTNGKGSTCAYIESILRAYGKKTGLFTSPHLVRFEERFMIGGRPISEELWVRVYSDLAGVIEAQGLTFFEAVTLIALELFKRERVEWAVLETGMGGRLDATNIVVPRVSVITSLDLDHMHYLGSDLPSIAREKLGIVKRRVPLVMARPARSDVLKIAEGHCALMDAPCRFVSADEAQDRCATAGSTGFTVGGHAFTTRLRGEFQVLNALTALRTAECAGFSDPAITADGIARTGVPGRFHVVVRNGRTVVFDVGHNPAAARAFSDALRRRYEGATVCMVVGIMKDKDIAGILQAYCSVASRLILTQPKIERAAELETLARKVPAGFTGNRDCIADVGKAAEAGLAGAENIVCIAGSFHTVGEAMMSLEIEPYGPENASVFQF